MNSPGLNLIATERDRQANTLEYDAAHDAKLTDQQLAMAATAYLFDAIYSAGRPGVPAPWPWASRLYHKASPLRMLVKAGALIAAEIDRRIAAGETE